MALGTPDEVAALRAQLWTGGFRPVAVHNPIAGEINSGKAPVGKDWPDLARRNPPFHAISIARKDSLNTGLLSDGLRAVDIDIDDPAIVSRVTAIVYDILGGEPPTRYRNNSPRITAIYRAAEGTPSKRVLAGKHGKVEILGKGQQFVAFGQHYTGADLQWMPESLADIKLSDLPSVTEDQITDLFAALAPIIEAVPERTNGTGATNPSPLGFAADALQVLTALTILPNTGPADWEQWNLVGMATWRATNGSEAGRGGFHGWSQKNDAYDAVATNARWDHYRASPPTRVGAGTLFWLAKQAMPRQDDPPPNEEPPHYEEAWEGPDFDPEPESAPNPRISPIWHSSEEWDEENIPRRNWLAKGYFMRGAVSLIAGAGSAGKSSLAKAWAVACALGVKFSEFQPAGRLRIMTYNVEDDLDEEHRRLSATLREFKASPRDLEGRITIVGPKDVGTLVHRDPQSGRIQLTATMEALEALIVENSIDILMLDPLVELHTSEENDNTGLRAVIAAFRSLAQRLNIAVVLFHHTRKGSTTPGDPDAIRGAGAIVGAARMVFTLCVMTEDEAAALSIPSTQRKNYFRLDSAKSNYAPGTDGEWFERIPYELANGETVPATRPWVKPRDTIYENDFLAIERLVSEGLPGSVPYSFSKLAAERWIGHLCIAQNIKTADGIKEVVDRLKSSGFAHADFTTKSRNTAKGIRSPDGAPTHAAWLD